LGEQLTPSAFHGFSLAAGSGKVKPNATLGECVISSRGARCRYSLPLWCSRLREDRGNFFLWNILLERVRHWPVQRELSAELETKVDQQPADLDLLFLYGRSLMSLDTPEGIQVFEKVLERDPEYAWVYRLHAYIRWGQSRFRDEAKLKDPIRAVFRLCPDDTGIYWVVRGLDDGRDPG
jgi:hypothetical protein